MFSSPYELSTYTWWQRSLPISIYEMGRATRNGPPLVKRHWESVALLGICNRLVRMKFSILLQKDIPLAWLRNGWSLYNFSCTSYIGKPRLEKQRKLECKLPNCCHISRPKISWKTSSVATKLWKPAPENRTYPTSLLGAAK